MLAAEGKADLLRAVTKLAFDPLKTSGMGPMQTRLFDLRKCAVIALDGSPYA